MDKASLLRAWDEFRLHVRSGLTQGDLTKDELKEIIIQATAYCGAPAGNPQPAMVNRSLPRLWQCCDAPLRDRCATALSR